MKLQSDLLVNCAGVNKAPALQDITEEDLDCLLTLDHKKYILMMHCAARYMIDHGTRINNAAPGAVRVRSDQELLEIRNGKDTDYFRDKKFLTDPDAVKDHDFWDELGGRIPPGRVDCLKISAAQRCFWRRTGRRILRELHCGRTAD